jgi:ketosteroid isomerase-like protein
MTANSPVASRAYLAGWIDLETTRIEPFSWPNWAPAHYRRRDQMVRGGRVTDKEHVVGWLGDYAEAWRSNDRQRIVALFTADATYRYHPYDDPVVGADAIAASWLEDPDDPDSWEASYVPVAVDGDTAVAVGTSRYRHAEDRPARTYHNCFVIRFDMDGRCRDFTEWYMKEPIQPEALG